MKKLVLLFMIISIASCDEISTQETVNNNNPILELKGIKSLDLNSKNGRVMNSDVNQLKEVTVNLDGQDMTGRIAFLEKEEDGVQRIAMLGSDDIAYSYVDITESDGVLNARYYTHSGELYMETVLENETIKILGAYNLVGSSNSRAWGWFDRFDSCVDRFVETVTTDAEWSAVFVIGAACCAAEVLAGLAIGCSIAASR